MEIRVPFNWYMFRSTQTFVSRGAYLRDRTLYLSVFARQDTVFGCLFARQDTVFDGVYACVSVLNKVYYYTTGSVKNVVKYK